MPDYDDGIQATISGREVLELAAQVKMLVPSVERAAAISEQVENLIPVIERLCAKIEGNGKPGIETRLSQLELWQIPLADAAQRILYIEEWKRTQPRLAALERWQMRVDTIVARTVALIGIPIILAAVFFIAGVVTHRISITFQ